MHNSQKGPGQKPCRSQSPGVDPNETESGFASEDYHCPPSVIPQPWRSNPPARQFASMQVPSRSYVSPSEFALSPRTVQEIPVVRGSTRAAMKPTGLASSVGACEIDEPCGSSIIRTHRKNYDKSSQYDGGAVVIPLGRPGFRQYSSQTNASMGSSTSYTLPPKRNTRYRSSKVLGSPCLSTLSGKNSHRNQSPISPPAVPNPTDLYLAQCHLPVRRRVTPQRLLVVLDLNGTLLVRPNRMNLQLCKIRPGVNDLLRYIIDNHTGMIYSSARQQNVDGMVHSLLGSTDRDALVAIWARDKLDLTPRQFNEKVQVYKKLEKIWADQSIQAASAAGQHWGQHNTVLIDDNRLKALGQPHNLIQVPEFTKTRSLNKHESQREREIVWGIQVKLEELMWSQDVSRHILRWETGEMEPPHTTNPTKGINPAVTDCPRQLSTVSCATTLDSTSQSSDDGGVDIQATLGEGMEKLTTDPMSNDDNCRIAGPAITAEEWQEFLK